MPPAHAIAHAPAIAHALALAPAIAHSLALALAIALLPLTLAAQTTKGNPKLEVAAAKVLMEQDQEEQAAIALRNARRLVENDKAIPDKDKRDWYKQIDRLLGKVDRDGKRLVQAQQKIAEDMIELAGRYRAAGWIRTAREVLLSVESLAPEEVARRLGEIGQPPRRKVAKATDNRDLLAWFKLGTEAYGITGWWVSLAEGAVSPKLVARTPRENTTMLVANQEVSGDVRITLQARLAPGGQVSFGWGIPKPWTSPQTFYLLQVLDSGAARVLQLQPAKGFQALHVWRLGPAAVKAKPGAESQSRPLSTPDSRPDSRPQSRPGAEPQSKPATSRKPRWVTMDITLRGNKAEVRVDKMTAPVVVTAPDAAALRGRLGLYIPGNSKVREPVRFRFLKVTKL